jgi:hypothetical protein
MLQEMLAQPEKGRPAPACVQLLPSLVGFVVGVHGRERSATA